MFDSHISQTNGSHDALHVAIVIWNQCVQYRQCRMLLCAVDTPPLVFVFKCDGTLQETWMLLLLALLPIAWSFYVPGVAPINFHQNTPVEIKVRQWCLMYVKIVIVSRVFYIFNTLSVILCYWVATHSRERLWPACNQSIWSADPETEN